MANMYGLRLATIFTLVLAMSPPSNFPQLECAVNQFALQYAARLVPSHQLLSVHDALNIDQLCSKSSSDETSSQRHTYKPSIFSSQLALNTGTGPTFFVALDGSDSGQGTIASPFATLKRAQAATHSAGCSISAPCTVFVRAGTYHLGDLGGTVRLGVQDAHVAYTSYHGEHVVLTGAKRLGNLSWSPYVKVPGAFRAAVHIEDARVESWLSSHPEKRGKAGPPPLVGDLFVDGVRQVRARYPNGNPQDNSGICFSATQRAGEGCPGYTTCAKRKTGQQPSPAGIPIRNIGPNRGLSPTQVCLQCAEHYGTFEFTIFPPPSGHPI